ncbi:ABATE domain-containing protein [Dactylosporangium aurantiacum]|uniref:ABATE domain-containing protein n=1 Tax=Dactylosporangium aurantiacum TaxID=35754 RepID=A0A9Q9IFC6_9ACTN|nr:ABATE domain-containing protein [Dactylosporangium aurantiacum]MDG6104990.1 ABATE domain-containing protein [Dactylosporangium aurantiacum]UWZ51525.1 ABATE domain-containing protein [Dactylosporangium aurantiacum]
MSFRRGTGRLCLDFADTLRDRGTATPVDELADGAALAAWVGQFGPVAPTPGSSVPAAILAGARRLREAVHTLVMARAAGPGAEAGDLPAGAGGPGAEARGLVNDAAGRSVPVPRLDAGGALRWQAADPVTATLALVARDALDLVTSPAAGRVRACADPRCGALFLDGSRTGTRRWCAADPCGNRARRRPARTAASAGLSGARPPG